VNVVLVFCPYVGWCMVYVFSLDCRPEFSYCFCILHPEVEYMVTCKDLEEKEAWIKAITKFGKESMEKCAALKREKRKK